MGFGVPNEGSFSGERPHAEAVEQGDGEERELGRYTVLEHDLMEKGRGQAETWENSTALGTFLF